MSRIGLKPINVPAGVEVILGEENFVEVKGPKGTLSQQLSREMKITMEGNTINIERPSEIKRHKSLHGLTRTLLANMIEGVSNGFTKTLVIEGTGYRASKSGNKLTLNLGYSHPIEVLEHDGMTIEVPDPNKIVISGIDKQKLGNFAANIRSHRRPEPYKGKGIRYEGEYIRRKVGKTGK
ncbi:ribosomal protein L6 [Tissierellia bacterium KA00581]|jgi:hypothetical protein|nr:ribosomal protein L6 [Tissierellia bacterium KA00581]